MNEVQIGLSFYITFVKTLFMRLWMFKWYKWLPSTCCIIEIVSCNYVVNAVLVMHWKVDFSKWEWLCSGILNTYLRHGRLQRLGSGNCLIPLRDMVNTFPPEGSGGPTQHKEGSAVLQSCLNSTLGWRLCLRSWMHFLHRWRFEH